MTWIAVILALLPVGLTVEQRYQPFASRAACEAAVVDIVKAAHDIGAEVVAVRCVARREGGA